LSPKDTGICLNNRPQLLGILFVELEMSKCKICPSKSHGKCGYCLAHIPEDMRCTRTTMKGKRCKLPIIVGSDVCKVHLYSMMRGYGKGRYGWVYIFDTMHRKESFGIYKIGRSVNPKMRNEELRSGNPLGKILFSGFVGKYAKIMESKLHKKHQDTWIEREMFYLTQSDLDNIYQELYAHSSEWFQL
jgi:hypothetical protein